jgi:RNA polymerase sigma-70 factor (ECF subfamily)
MNTPSRPSFQTANPNDGDRQAEDLQLLRAIAEGDGRAFDVFVQRMEKLVFTVVYRVLEDVQDTEDVCQEVFLSVWKKAGMFDRQRGKASTWITTLARNRAIDRIRQKQRRARLHDEFGEKVEERHEVDSSVLVETKERGLQLRKAVKTLSPEQREAIELVYFRGLTQGEIASELNQPLGTVKARIRRGIGKLREKVGPSLAAQRFRKIGG